MGFVSNFVASIIILVAKTCYNDSYRIAGIFGGINLWRIAELKVFGEIMFIEWIDFGHKDTIYKLWQIAGDSPILPNFLTVKHSRYTVYCTEKTK